MVEKNEEKQLEGKRKARGRGDKPEKTMSELDGLLRDIDTFGATIKEIKTDV